MSIHNVREFDSYESTPDDIARLKLLPQSACPRAHCWWWRSLSFEWDIEPKQGCRFLQSDKPEHWDHLNTPCCRADATSSVDHYESRAPEDDGFSDAYWRGLPPSDPDKPKD